MEHLDVLLRQSVGPWTIGQLAGAFLLLMGAVVTRAIIAFALGRRLRRLAARTETRADDLAVGALTGPLGWLIVTAGVYLAFRVLAREQSQMLATGNKVYIMTITVLVAWSALRLIDAGFMALGERAARTDSKLDDQLIPLLRKVSKVFVGILTFLLVVQNLGYSVSGLLAGLGIGGLAFALAAQDTLANLFGSVTVLVDRPFRVGDWIAVEGAEGTVEEIGLRSTRIRTFARTLISIPNKAVANATIINNSMMPSRRATFTVGVTYDTTAAQMRAAVAGIEEILRGHPGVIAEDVLVKFGDFGASSLDIAVRYFTRDTTYAEHLAVRQEVNLAIMELLEGMGLSIAFPTQTVHLVKEEQAI